MLRHHCADHGLRNGSQIRSKPIPFCIDDTQPQRASSEVAVGCFIACSTDQQIALRVAPMFVTDGKPNMQHAEFTEDLRDDGLELWQPVVAHWPDGFSGTVPGVPVLRWQMHQRKQTGPRYSRDRSQIRVKTERDADGGGSRDCALQAAEPAHLG